MNRYILAGMFACSNMGQQISVHDLAQALKRPPTTTEDAAIAFCAPYMDEEGAQEVFEDEAASWYKELSKLSDESIATTWPHIVKLYREAKP